MSASLPPITAETALEQLREQADETRAAQMRDYHKQSREVLGVGNQVLGDLAREWRAACTPQDRLSLAQALWDSDVFEARIAAAKVLTQARIREDEQVWTLLCSWVPAFDSWAIADAASSAIGKRIMAAPERLDTVEDWSRSPHMWSRRAALVSTLPFAKLAHPKPAELAARSRILGWAASSVPDRDWFIQKAIAWWLRDLSKHDPQASRDFLERHGADMKGFARKEAARFLGKEAPDAQDPAAAGHTSSDPD